MVGRTSYASGIKVANRTRPCGLKIKTTVPDAGTSDIKSSATTSTDWRKRAAAISSPGANIKRSKASHGANNEVSIRLDFEADTSFAAPQYRYPKEKRAPWETVVSAPAWQLPSSSSSTSGDEPREVTKVQLRHISPVVTTVNGEDITLPDQFSIDVTVVDPNSALPGLTPGDLQRLNGLAPFRRIPPKDSDDLLIELQEILSYDLRTFSSATSASSEFHDTRYLRGQDGSYSAISSFSNAESESGHAQTESLSDEEVRFQRLLSRLQKDQQPSQRNSRGNNATLPHHNVVDPAIVAMKVRNKVEVPERNSQSGPDKEAANAFFALQLDQMRNSRHPNSADSGYASNDRGHNASGPHTRNELSLDDGKIKTLNPAAAEFKLTTQTDDIQWVSPKKMSRPPLTNIFPDAMSDRLPLSHTFASGSILLEDSQQTRVPAVAGQTHGNRVLENGVFAMAALSASQPVAQAPEFAGSMNGIYPKNLPTAKGHAPQIAQSLAAAVPATALADSPLLATYGTLPSAVTLGASTSFAPLALSSINGFNTFPPAVGASVPVFNQTAAATVFNPHFPATGPFVPASQPQLPTGLGGSKPNRPYFPVTTKPRDHDPVKQQMYEAYLEWRKANEPGYHMKCKMRQANRVMRQCQQQQEKVLVADPANWKMIAEKAKAAVGAAAAAAAAEKKRRQDSVREEMRAKVRELSRELQGGVTVGVKA